MPGDGAGAWSSAKDQTQEQPEQKKKKKNRKKRHHRQRPERLVRTVVATTAAVEPFGWMGQCRALKRKMYAAKKRAFIGDGGNWIRAAGPDALCGLDSDIGLPGPAGGSVRGLRGGVCKRSGACLEVV